MILRAPIQGVAARLRPDAGGHSARMLRFVLAGLVNTGFGYALYALLVAAGLHPQAALAIQFGVGVIWNYTTHGRYVFGVWGDGRLPRYALSYAVIYLFNAVLLHGLIGAGLGAYAAQAVALAPTVALSYVLVSLALGVPLRNRGGRS